MNGKTGVCDGKYEHDWQPVSFRFETQLLDQLGRVKIRQPDLEAGRVYVVCMTCSSHSYVETKWIGFRLSSAWESDDEELNAEDREDEQ